MTVSASAYERIQLEKYFPPAWVTHALLEVEPFRGIWDPAAGDGGILQALPQGLSQCGSDISPDAEGIGEADFFSAGDGLGFDIVTNPPYGIQSRLAVQFIEHALVLTQPYGGKVAMLLKVGFDSAGGRSHLFRDHPAFVAEHRLTRRIRWTNFEQKAAGPTENHSWFVWDWRKRGGPAVKGYLPLKEAIHA